MAKVEEEEVVEEYESDPEEAKLSLISRRREASDDEQQPQDEDDDYSDLLPKRIAPDSDLSYYESDGQGAAAEYDDDDGELEGEELEEHDDLEEGETEAVELAVGEFLGANNRALEEEDKGVDHQFVADGDDDNVGVVDGGGGGDGDGDGTEEKKPNEPFAVPTAGAFYMHDDRFRDSSGGRNRRTPGGRKLWESKDDKKWGHDKFEEMINQQRHSEDGRRASRDRNRGRGKNRGEEHGYPRGNRPKTFNNNNQNNVPANQNNALNNQVNPPKGVRGRGPRRYHSVWKAYGEAPTENKQFGKSVEKSSDVTLGRVSEFTPSVESDKAPARKHVFSRLNSASPPFYPSATSNKEINLTRKKDGQGAPPQLNLQTDDESFPVSQSNTVRGKDVTDSMNKLFIDDPICSGKPLTNFDSEASGSLNNTSQSSQSRAQGRGQVTYHPTHHNQSNVPHNQVNRLGNPSNQRQYAQRAPVQTRGQPPAQASVPQLGHSSGSVSQSSSPPKPAHMSASFESRDIVSPPESSKSKTALVGKGKSNVQGNGSGSFPYGGAQILGAPGNLSNAHGDQNFPANPTFLPVMQFGGQHPGGMGVPAVGMAFPGYVGNPALGNSEMTWLPVLAGTAGGLGATYPYLSLDGAYHAHSSGQISSLAGASSKENITNNPGNELKPSQRTELANDEYGQRQNKTLRYTQMKFDQ